MKGTENIYVYRIVTESEIDLALTEGKYPWNDFDRRSGFFHLSGLEKILETANLHFKPEQKLKVLKIHVDRLHSDLKWESVPSRGGAEFPHLYRHLSDKEVDERIDLIHNGHDFQFADDA